MEVQVPGRTESAAFAANLRHLRQQCGWSQAELARRVTKAGAPMKANRVATIEAPGPGPRTISIDQAAAFAEVLGTTVQDLLGKPLDERRAAALHRMRRAAQAARMAQHEVEEAHRELAAANAQWQAETQAIPGST